MQQTTRESQIQKKIHVERKSNCARNNTSPSFNEKQQHNTCMYVCAAYKEEDYIVVVDEQNEGKILKNQKIATIPKHTLAITKNVK